MYILILLLCFISIFFIIGVSCIFNLKEILLKSIIIFSIILVLLTETLSYFHLINFNIILISWVLITIISFIFLYKSKNMTLIFLNSTKAYILTILFNFFNSGRFLFHVILFLIFLILIQGIVYPPNNWDSMTYHLPRIISWISNQSVSHFQTHIIRQLYQPPFCEFIIMHFNILSQSDYFSNSVQFIFFIFTIIANLAIIDLLKLGYHYKIFAIILIVTIPEAVLEASTTQNDIVLSFFILTTIYYGIKLLYHVKIENYIFFGISVGLSLLTKGTSYIYIAPIIFILTILIFYNFFKTKNYNYIKFSILSFLFIIFINSGHFIRNYYFNNNIIGVDKIESNTYRNEKMSTSLLISNIIKNIGLHLGPTPLNTVSDKLIYKLHTYLKIDINNLQTNYANTVYGAPSLPNSEDSAPNPIHLFLILYSFLIIFINFFISKNNNLIFLYSISFLIQVLLFSFLLRWQPWNSRLHLPLFISATPLICFALSLNTGYFKFFIKLIPFLLFYVYIIIIFNYQKPYFKYKGVAKISMMDNRLKKYFSPRLYLYNEYQSIITNLNTFHNINIGLLFGPDTWEYPLTNQFYRRNIKSIHINVENTTKGLPYNLQEIDYIISTIKNDTLINFRGYKYYNINSKNKFIWLYQKS